MTRARMLGTTIIAVAIMAAPTARAQPVTQDQAKALEAQLRGWVAGLITPKTDLTTMPIHILPDGDHFRVEQPIAGALGTTGIAITGAPITASIKPLAGNRWAIDNLLPPSPLTVKLTGEKPEKNGEFTRTVEKQEMHAILDPSLATTSSYDIKMAGITYVIHTAMGTQTDTIARLTGHGVMTPKDGKGMGLRNESTLEGYASSFPTRNGTPVTIAADRVHSSTVIEQFSFARMGEVLRVSSAIGALGNAHSLAAKALTQQLLLALADLCASADGETTVDGLHVDANGHATSVKKVTVATGFGAPAGKADGHLKLSADGIDSPDIPEAFREILPHHIAISPRISGIPKATLVKVLQDGIDNQGSPKPDGRQLLAKLLKDGPLTLGLDSLELDLGPAILAATGKLDITSPTQVSGEADIRMTGLDALIRKVNTVPQLRMAATMLVFLKGLGEQDGKDTEWAIKYADNKLTVNDTDVSSMIPHGKPKLEAP
jgi:uncharacterized protein DUF2125